MTDGSGDRSAAPSRAAGTDPKGSDLSSTDPNGSASDASRGDDLPHALRGKIVISIDAMGGDKGPAPVIQGMAKSAAKNPDIGFIVHGPRAELEPLIARRKLGDRCVIRDAEGVVTMDAKPSHVMRHGKGTSMWSAIESVRDKQATVAVSCGNTGALMAVSMVRLRRLPGVARPAIACLWPSRNPQGFNSR